MLLGEELADAQLDKVILEFLREKSRACDKRTSWKDLAVATSLNFDVPSQKALVLHRVEYLVDKGYVDWKPLRGNNTTVMFFCWITALGQDALNNPNPTGAGVSIVYNGPVTQTTIGDGSTVYGDVVSGQSVVITKPKAAEIFKMLQEPMSALLAGLSVNQQAQLGRDWVSYLAETTGLAPRRSRCLLFRGAIVEASERSNAQVSLDDLDHLLQTFEKCLRDEP